MRLKDFDGDGVEDRIFKTEIGMYGISSKETERRGRYVRTVKTSVLRGLAKANSH